MTRSKRRSREASGSRTCPVPWIDGHRGYLVDWVTQVWVKTTGKAVKRDQEWLDVPFGSPSGIGDSFFEALAKERGLRVVREAKCGLIENFGDLSGADFKVSNLDKDIVEFYEKTSDYELDLWSEWCGLFRPFGWMVSYTFSRRLQQLNLPLRPLALADGIKSELVQLRDDENETKLTGWLRTHRKTDEVIYVGFYSHCATPESNSMVRVAFPLPNGCAVVMMRPEALLDGSLLLRSDGVNGAGFYFLLQRDESTLWMRRVRTFHESIHVWSEGDGRLAAEHVLKFLGLRVMRMRYGIRRI